MLKNIKLLEKLSPSPLDTLLISNEDFQGKLKVLSPFFDFDFATADQAERTIFYYNLLYLAERDLSLAHCVQHNHKARFAISSGDNSTAKKSLTDTAYHEIICCYSSHRAVDTIQYDPVTNTLTPGIKGWLSNLISAKYVAIEVTDISVNKKFSSGHITHINGVTPDVYTVFLDLSKVNHSISETVSPTAIGMTGASPGVLTLHDTVPVGTDTCYMLKLNPRQDYNYPWSSYVRMCWSTVHLGVIIGLYNELLKYTELKDPGLAYKLKTIEIDISSLKILWEHSIEHMILNTGGGALYGNPVMPASYIGSTRDTQYAFSKKILLELISFVLEVGLNQFIDDTTPQWIRFRDAITYVTHMASLYRCNNKYEHYNKF
jgi:hypothetical protein